MSYIETTLSDGETVIYQAKVSLWSFWRIFFMAALLFLAWAMYAEGIFGIFLVVVGVSLLLHIWIRYISTELAITNKKVVAKFGFIRRETYEINLERVEGVQVIQGIVGRILEYGSVKVSSAGEQAPVPYIKNPVQFRREVSRIQEEEKSD